MNIQRIAAWVLLLSLCAVSSCSQFEPRDKRFYWLAFIATKPRLNPNKEAIAPRYMKLAWRAENTFDEAHALHRATYCIMVSNEADKGGEIQRLRDHNPATCSSRPRSGFLPGLTTAAKQTRWAWT